MIEINAEQIQRYRQMTGEQRLRIGLGLFETAVNVAREAVRRQLPNENEQTIEREVQKRIRIGYELQQRDVYP